MHYEETLTDFQRLMLLRCFRIDRIYRAVTEYVAKIMGEKYVMPPIISFESIFEQSTPLSPIVFILSPGSDPATDLMKLAERSGFGSNKLKYLSLGQGQEKVGLRYSQILTDTQAGGGGYSQILRQGVVDTDRHSEILRQGVVYSKLVYTHRYSDRRS